MTVLSKFITVFFNEVIKEKDNTPTKISVLLYAYFQMFYDFGSLYNKNMILSTDRVKIPLNYLDIQNYLSSNQETIEYVLYVGHESFMSTLYPTYPAFQMRPIDYGIKKFTINESTLKTVIWWAGQFLTGKSIELKRSGIITNNKTGLPCDFTGSYDYKNKTPNNWANLIVPNGTLKKDGLPIIDLDNPSTYNVQNFLGQEYYLNEGFAVNPKKNIIDLSSQISLTWETGLKEQMDKIIDLYGKLTDEQKMTAELFAGSGPTVLPPPGIMIVIALQISEKYEQSLENEIKMLFMLGGSFFDACVSAWWYKSTYNQARPVSLIRHYYKNKILNSWNPEYATTILGEKWLPYQDLTFVTPPFPDVASGHTVFSRTSGKLLDWWFNYPVLYDTFSLSEMPNQKIICPSLILSEKICSIGEYIFPKGSSVIEPGFSPTKDVVLRYRTIKEVYEAAGMSRIYGGIHTYQTNDVSAQLADWVYSQTLDKLKNQFKFFSPYK